MSWEAGKLLPRDMGTILHHNNAQQSIGKYWIQGYHYSVAEDVMYV